MKPIRYVISRVAALAGLAFALAGCSGEESAPPPGKETPADAPPLESFERRTLTDDIVEYSATITVGGSPTDRIRLHRVVREREPFHPRSTRAAVMLLHGDFSTFDTNFVLASLPDAALKGTSLAAALAAVDIDVWGFDRRGTLLPSDATDFSSLRSQGYLSALGDVERALGLAQELRAAEGAGKGQLTLGGFSRGAQLAYAYAGMEAQRPAEQRLVRALVPIDVYYRLGPDGETSRQAACKRYHDDAMQIADGVYQSDNTVFSQIGQLSRGAPMDPSTILSGMSNREALLALLTQTYLAFDATPSYHLAGGTFAGEAPTGVNFSPLERLTDWFVDAAPFQAFAEITDGDALWCGEDPLPVADHLADIRVPVYAVGAAGGFGELARYTTEQLGSADVTFALVRRLPPGQEASDYGHGDLLYAADAPELVFAPLARWIVEH